MNIMIEVYYVLPILCYVYLTHNRGEGGWISYIRISSLLPDKLEHDWHHWTVSYGLSIVTSRYKTLRLQPDWASVRH